MKDTANMTSFRHALSGSMLPKTVSTVEWCVSHGLVDYDQAVTFMEERSKLITQGIKRELVWLLEHPPLYTSGTSANSSDLVEPVQFPVYTSDRGGQYTYHGPGQRIVYIMLDLSRRQQDVRMFVATLEDWLIASLDTFNIKGYRCQDRVGVWVSNPKKGSLAEDKIAAIGIRIRRWVTQHGVSLNISPQLDHFRGIIPCGIREHGVTSFSDLGLNTSMVDVDKVLRYEFEKRFGSTETAQAPI